METPCYCYGGPLGRPRGPLRVHKLSISDDNVYLNISHDLVSRIHAYLYEKCPQWNPNETVPSWSQTSKVVTPYGRHRGCPSRPRGLPCSPTCTEIPIGLYVYTVCTL